MSGRRSHDGNAPAPDRDTTSLNAVLDRFVDVVVSGLTLALTLPALVLAAVAIRLDSAGPVIVRRVRVGKAGAPFEQYLLRSTAHDSGQVTRVGRVLRWSSIDELPQAWNVLRGDMSLVGPPPASPDEVQHGWGVGDDSGLRPMPGLTGTWSEADEPGFG